MHYIHHLHTFLWLLQRGSRLTPSHISLCLAGELKERYALRLRSRMSDMFNLAAFPGTSPDNRINNSPSKNRGAGNKKTT